MSKRPAIDLMALTAEQATPMPEAAQRMPPAANTSTPPGPTPVAKAAPAAPQPVPTSELENLSFKVPPKFRKRFRTRAFEADMKQNELLFAALAAWEVQHGISKS